MSKTRKIAGAVVLTALLGCAAAPASAGFFDRLFGGFIRHARPPVELPNMPRMSPIPGERIAPQGRDDWRPRSEGGGPRMAYCVRTCDGRYFPVHPHAGFSATQMCSRFCPASETKLYVGSGIDRAVGADGRRYSELPQAYAYRKQLVAGCTCNSKDVFGVARIDIDADPTLRRGDIVATREGMMVVSGETADGPQLTAAQDYRGISRREREQLSQIHVAGSGGDGRSRAPATDGRSADRD